MGQGAGRELGLVRQLWILTAALPFAGCPTIQPSLNPPNAASSASASSAGSTGAATTGGTRGTSSSSGSSTGTTGASAGAAGSSGSGTTGAASSSGGSGGSSGSGGGVLDAGTGIGTVFYCDETLGIDREGCGLLSNPCHSTFWLMNSDIIKTPICNAGAPTGARIELLNAGVPASGDWLGEADGGAIDLGLGVTLHAPGVYFAASSTNFAIGELGPTALASISVAHFCSFGVGAEPVVIEGDPGNPAYIGIHEDGTIPPNNIGLAITGSTAVLSNVGIAGQIGVLAFDGAVEFGPGAVQIGGLTAGSSTTTGGEVGLECYGDTNFPVTVGDIGGGTVMGPAAQTVLTILDQSIADIQVGDNCTVSLTLAPQLGATPPCPSPLVEGAGVVANGNASVTLQGARLSCALGDGIDSAIDGTGAAPTLTFLDGRIEANAGAGIHLNGGDLALVGSELHDNSVGVWVDSATAVSSTVLLGDDLLCSKLQPGAPGGWTTAVDVWNASLATVSATQTTWNDPTAKAWSCPSDAPPSASGCSCATDAGCTVGTTFDIADVVGGTVTATNDQPTNSAWSTCVP
jgi:hypothetical protein